MRTGFQIHQMGEIHKNQQMNDRAFKTAEELWQPSQIYGHDVK